MAFISILFPTLISLSFPLSLPYRGPLLFSDSFPHSSRFLRSLQVSLFLCYFFSLISSVFSHLFLSVFSSLFSSIFFLLYHSFLHVAPSPFSFISSSCLPNFVSFAKRHFSHSSSGKFFYAFNDLSHLLFRDTMVQSRRKTTAKIAI